MDSFFTGTHEAPEKYLRIMGPAEIGQVSGQDLITLSAEAERILAPD